MWMKMAAVAVCCTLMTSGLAQASITITGTGKVKYVPDMAYLSLSASTEATTAGQAWKDNAAVVKKIFAALRVLDIPEKDLHTGGMSLNPKYVHPRDQEPRLVGYVATYDLRVTVRKMKEIGKVLDQAVENGANQRVGIQFASSQADKLLDQARLAAVREARKKAELYVQGAGAGLGLVRSISEGNATPWMRQELCMPMKAGGASSLPIAAGEQELSISVTLTYDLIHTTK
jgi:uncharacterized protein YggE